MIKIATIEIPTAWAELSWNDYLALCKNDLSFICKDEDFLMEHIGIIEEAISFMSEPFPLLEPEFDVIEKEFARYADAVQYLRAYKDTPNEVLPYLVAIYTLPAPYSFLSMQALYKDVLKSHFLETYHIAKDALQKIAAKENELAVVSENYPIKKRALKKGEKAIPDYSRKVAELYGYYYIIDLLAQGDLLRHDAIVSLPAFDVIEKIKFNIVSNYFESLKYVNL